MAGLTVPSVIAVAASPGHQPLAPAVQTWSTMAHGMMVVAVQVSLHTSERRAADEHPGSLRHVGPVLALAHAYEIHSLIILRRTTRSLIFSERLPTGDLRRCDFVEASVTDQGLQDVDAGSVQVAALLV
ncbi:hypothetical protein [Streptomyces sp. NBC_01718]|uniref:hypothetical protein n=1 Tax=Streptomyces sp. NBC_01718 TaxID=2975919 RepID=UPI00352D1248